MRSPVILTLILVLTSSLAFAGKFDNLPDVDPELNQPGMELPRVPLPKPATRQRVIVQQPPVLRAVPEALPGPPAGYSPQPLQQGYPVPEYVRHARLYDGYRGPRPMYRPYYNPQPIDPVMGLVLGFVANALIPAILNRRY